MAWATLARTLTEARTWILVGVLAGVLGSLGAYEYHKGSISIAVAVASGVFALDAAGFWFWSAAPHLPRLSKHSGSEGKQLRVTREEIETRQGQRNAVAATFAGVAAIMQVVSTMLTP